MKRIFDIAAAAIALLLLCLPLAVLTLLVRRKLGHPAFFRQTRPGLHGRPFEMVKFRSMTDARGPGGALLPDADRLTRHRVRWRPADHVPLRCFRRRHV